MFISGGALALAGVLLLVNLNLQLASPLGTLQVPDAPVVQQLHDRQVQVDWNDIPGADRYELQLWHPTGWRDLPDGELNVEVEYFGSRAIVRKHTAGALIGTFRVRALGCGSSSDWSGYGRKVSAHSADGSLNLGRNINHGIAVQEPVVVWSGMLTVGTTRHHPGEHGYSLAANVGLLSPNEFKLEQQQFRIVQALQASDGFSLELQHPSSIPDEFTLAIHNSESGDVTSLSACDSLRLKTEQGEKFVWIDADVDWVAGSHSALSISLTRNSSPYDGEDLLRSVQPLTASFEQVPPHHSGEHFSVFLRFSEPTAMDGGSLRQNALKISAGAVTSMRPVDGRRELWEIRIAPDNRRSVRVRLQSAPGCGLPGSICTQHKLRLSNQPEAVILGPPIEARFVAGTEFHSGSHLVPVRIHLSEPLLTNAHSLRQRAIQATGGALTELRRVEGRSDLWELMLAPESAAAIDVTLDPGGPCRGGGMGCLDDLYRIANPMDLSIPPAVVYLTFDDGPHPTYTPRILDILSWYGARATFFVTGESAMLYPDLIQRIVSEGHTLANHTWDHVALDTLSDEEFEETVLRTQQALGEHATPCIRPPYYRADDETYERADQLGLRVIMGNVRPRDWARPGALTIADRIVGGAAPNAVVVLHDGGGDRSQTVEGLELALAHLQTRNYSFEPVCG